MRTVEKLMTNKINRSLYLCFGGKIWVNKVNSPIHTTYFYTNHMHVMLSNNVMKNKIDNRKRFGNAIQERGNQVQPVQFLHIDLDSSTTSDLPFFPEKLRLNPCKFILGQVSAEVPW